MNSHMLSALVWCGVWVYTLGGYILIKGVCIMGDGKVLTESRYAKLLGDIRKVIADGRAKAESEAKNILVGMYWAIGKRICELIS